MADDNAAPTTEPAETAARERPLSLLAREMFGSNFHGEVRQPAPAPEPEPSPEPQPEGDPAPEPEPSPEPEKGEEPETEEVPISSLEELTAHNEWDPDWVNTLKVAVKVDGESAEATLKDLVASYQMNTAADKRLEEAKAKAKALNQELAEKSAALEGQFATVAKLIENAEKVLDEDVAGIDWKHLRSEDPAEYSAKKTEIKERRERIDKMKDEAVLSWRAQVEQQQKEAQEQLQQHMQAESAALLEKLPEWRDSEIAKAEKAEIVNDLIDRGFSREDVLGASNHRLILLARDAWQFRKMKANSDVARKKVAKVPKVLKPGAPKPQEQIEKEKTEKLHARLKQTGSIDDAVALLRAKRRQ